MGTIPRGARRAPRRSAITYLLLLLLKLVSRTFWRLDQGWVGEVPADPWGDDVRLVAILNHTSLYEPLFAGMAPNRFLRRIARHGVVPVAAKTLDRPMVGRFFRLIAPHVVPVTRRRDSTWDELTAKVDERAMVIILPEGRMKRRSGLDSQGKPMTVRGGIADVLAAVPDGRFLIAYSGGLHHVQVPGQLLPRLFQLLRMRFESLDIPTYRAILMASCDGDPERFKQAVIDDLHRRRDTYCPPMERAAGIHYEHA